MDKIVFFEIEEFEKPLIEKSITGQNIVFSDVKLTEKNVSDFSDATVISGFIYSELPKEILEKLPNLKMIATRSTGFDHVDLAYCKEKGIVVSNVPTYGAHTVAEQTFALILALSRKLIPAVERTKRGDFSQEGLTGFDLFGKTLGIIGLGNIGTNVLDLGLAFGMKVIVFTRHPDGKYEGKDISWVSDIESLVSVSDIVTLHVPYTKETHHMINMQNIQQFKKGSYLINTARGPLIETQAILEGLEKGILAGCGLDVLEEECGLKEERELLTGEFLKSCDLKTQLLNHVLLGRDDVIVTPHNAFHSKEALEQILETTIANIKGFLAGIPQNTVS